jgi:hypothetical protein
MINKICDSCKKSIYDDYIVISSSFNFERKDFCWKCQKSAVQFLKECFNKFKKILPDEP